MYFAPSATAWQSHIRANSMCGRQSISAPARLPPDTASSRPIFRYCVALSSALQHVHRRCVSITRSKFHIKEHPNRFPCVNQTRHTMPSVPTRQLGKNGPNVPALGFGAMGLSASYGAVGDNEARFAVLDRALELGTTFWDSSDVCKRLLLHPGMLCLSPFRCGQRRPLAVMARAHW